MEDFSKWWLSDKAPKIEDTMKFDLAKIAFKAGEAKGNREVLEGLLNEISFEARKYPDRGSWNKGFKAGASVSVGAITRQLKELENK